MLLFLMGVGLPELVVIGPVLFGVGLVIFWLTGKLVRRVVKGVSDRTVTLLSWLSAFILSPVILIGVLALFIVSIQNAPIESDEENLRSHYQMMEEGIKEDLKVGMSKTEIVSLFGEADTTQSVLIYDLSPPDAKEKYLLKITFDTLGLKDFQREH